MLLFGPSLCVFFHPFGLATLFMLLLAMFKKLRLILLLSFGKLQLLQSLRFAVWNLNKKIP